MSTTKILNNDIEKIIAGLKKLNKEEQQSILAQINATLILRKGVPNFANPPKNLKSLTMAQIDSIKHKSRNKKVHA
jgi:hypothetical protein